MPLASEAPGSLVGPSPRVALARAALEAALAVPGVVAGDAGPQGLRVTHDPGIGALPGVSVTAQVGGRYAVDLRLVACLVPLVPLGELVRRGVQTSAQRHGLADRLGEVNIEFGLVLDAHELAPGASVDVRVLP